MKIFGIALLVAVLVVESQPARILGFFPITSRSHVTFAQHAMLVLAEHGHKVTFVSPFSLGRVVENFNEVVIPVGAKNSNQSGSHENVENMLSVFPRILNQSVSAAHHTINHPEFKQIMKNNRFDLLVSGFFFNNFQLGLAAHFECPSVVLSSISNVRALNELVGQPSNSELTPNPISGLRKGPITLWERVMNFVATVLEWGFNIYVNRMNQRFYNINFPEPLYPSFEAVKKNVSIVLVNNHFAQTGVQPTLPNVIDISGVQVNTDPDPLSDEIHNWLDAEKNGAIFVYLKSSNQTLKLSNDTIELLLNSFRKLKQRVLWKINEKQVPFLPKNVRIQSKVNTDSVLSHTNLRAFVTDGQLDKLNDALYHGVPVMGIPFTADQYSNTKSVQDDGWGEIITFRNLTEASLDEMLKQVIYVQSYKEKVTKLSSVYRDRPMQVQNAIVYWMEYVMKYNGAHHLKYQGRYLSIWASTSLDILGLALILTWILYKLVMLGYRRVFKRKSLTDADSNKVKSE